MSLHVSKCHIVRNQMSWLNYPDTTSRDDAVRIVYLVGRPRYTINITLHFIFLLTPNCREIYAFPMLSWTFDSTPKTQDLILCN